MVSLVNKVSARLESKSLRVLEIDFVLYFTIWFSERTLVIHRPDLLGRPSDTLWVCFLKILFSILQWDFAHYTELFYISLCHMNLELLNFLKSFSRITSLFETSLLNHSCEFPFTLLFLAGATLSMTLVFEWSWNKDHSHFSKILIIKKLNFTKSFFITKIKCIVFQRVEFYFFMTTFIFIIFLLQQIRWWSDNLIFNIPVVSFYLENLPKYDQW